MSELTEAMKEYREIVDDLKTENHRYYMALAQSSMLLQNKAIEDAKQLIDKVLEE
jgi:sensor histidine kinase regulating citrate/malate metabolism